MLINSVRFVLKLDIDGKSGYSLQSTKNAFLPPSKSDILLTILKPFTHILFSAKFSRIRIEANGVGSSSPGVYPLDVKLPIGMLTYNRSLLSPLCGEIRIWFEEHPHRNALKVK